MVADLPVGKMFIRDLDQVFYQRGVRGLGVSITEVEEALRRVLPRDRRTVFVGGSAGGFAAMLSGLFSESTTQSCSVPRRSSTDA